MRTLFELFIRNGGFVTFVLVEVLCFILVIKFNTEQNSIFSYTTAQIGGIILEKKQSLVQYIDLSRRSDSLLAENARLQSDLYALRNRQSIEEDTVFMTQYDTASKAATIRPQFFYIGAEVIGNQVQNESNWLVINRGSTDGVEAGMGVVSRAGVIGIVRHVSKNFALVMSILNPQSRISARLGESGYFGSLVWAGQDPQLMTLRDIPKHAAAKAGQTVYTSGYSQMFPKGILIGVTGEPELKDGSNFYTIPVRLTQKMSDVHDVYVVRNIFYTELKLLEDSVANE
jgi:rod shape-determining protein MreC